MSKLTKMAKEKAKLEAKLAALEEKIHEGNVKLADKVAADKPEAVKADKVKKEKVKKEKAVKEPKVKKEKIKVADKKVAAEKTDKPENSIRIE